MDVNLLLNKVLNARKWEDVYTGENFRNEYIDYMKILHPDICNLHGATEAVAVLNRFKDEIEGMYETDDDAGHIQVLEGKKLIFSGDKTLLNNSLANYRKLMGLNDTASQHFKNYLPVDMEFVGDQLIARINYRVVPLTQLTLDQEHVNWILSRIFEFTSWLHQTGYCHAGINPSSILVVAETHGIICISFYHMTRINMKINTISGRYSSWYPPVLFTKKEAIPYIDLSLAQKTAVYLLGDKSGNGVKLKTSFNEALIDFLLTPHYDSFATYDSFRGLLKAQFGKPQFLKLNI